MNQDNKEGVTAQDRWSDALTWYVTLREGKEEDLRDAVGGRWAQWHADPENQRIFDDLSRMLAERHLHRMPARPTQAEFAEDRYDLSLPIAEWRRAQALRETRKQGQSARNRWWPSAGIGIAAITVLFLCWSLGFGPSAGPPTTVVYQTNVGQLRDVHLPDGSSITLGGHTKLSVALSVQRRSVSLLEGQAWFHVAHDPHWPFTVAAGYGVITDVGTAFLVTRESDRVIVTVTEGTVEVSARPTMRLSFKRDDGVTLRPVLAPIRLSRGEELAFNDNGALSRVKQADTHAATAWTHGGLTFDDQPLRYVVETVNRYSSRHIVVNPSAGALRYSGIVFENGIQDWLKSLEVIFPVLVEEQGDDVRIHMRSPNGPPSKIRP